MLLLTFVHISLFIKINVTQLVFRYQTLHNCLLDHLMNDIVKAIYLYIKHVCVVGVWLDRENAHSSKSYLDLSQLQALQNLIPNWQILLLS